MNQSEKDKLLKLFAKTIVEVIVKEKSFVSVNESLDGYECRCCGEAKYFDEIEHRKTCVIYKAQQVLKSKGKKASR